MTLYEYLCTLTNGSKHLLLFNSRDGVVILETIWYNTIPHEYYDWKIETVEEKEYEVRLGIHD